MNILGTHDTARILTVLGGITCNSKDEMAQKTAYLSPESKEKAIQKLKMAALLQFTLPGVPCIYYGDENGMEGHIDPFCRRCFNWNELNEELIGYYQRLGEIRKNYRDLFAYGIWQEIYAQDGILIYKREYKGKNLYIYVNRTFEKKYFKKEGKSFQELLTKEISKNAIIMNGETFGIVEEL